MGCGTDLQDRDLPPTEMGALVALHAADGSVLSVKSVPSAVVGQQSALTPTATAVVLGGASSGDLQMSSSSTE